MLRAQCVGRENTLNLLPSMYVLYNFPQCRQQHEIIKYVPFASPPFAASDSRPTDPIFPAEPHVHTQAIYHTAIVAKYTPSATKAVMGVQFAKIHKSIDDHDDYTHVGYCNH